MQTVTDRDGRFSVRNIPPGMYRVFAIHQDFVRAESEPLTLSAGQQRSDVVFNLTPTGVITGRVLDEFNYPISKVYVDALKASFTQGERVLNSVVQTQTDDRGEYRLYGLSPGRYFVSAVPYAASHIQRGGYITPTPPSPFAKGEGRASRSVGAMLMRGEFIDPMALNGETYVYNYYPGTPDMQSARPLDLRAGATLSGIDLGIVRVRGLRLSGQVIDGATGQPPGEGRISCRVNPELNTSLTVGSDASFELVGLSAGTYRIRCNTATLGGAVHVDVRQSDVNNVGVILQPRVILSGRVVFEGRLSGVETLDPRGIRVKLSAADPGTAVQASGEFTIPNLTVDEYPVTFSGLPGNAYVRSARLGDADALNAPIRLNAESRNMLDVVVSLRGGAVDALVVDDNQQPRPGAIVALVPDPSRRKRFDLYRWGIADAAGRIRIEGIPPGEFKIFAWQDIEENAWQDRDILSIHEDRGEPIRVGEGSKQEVKLRVIR
jgi:protocatechuate 3,4-dioxygenase beta subunit